MDSQCRMMAGKRTDPTTGIKEVKFTIKIKEGSKGQVALCATARVLQSRTLNLGFLYTFSHFKRPIFTHHKITELFQQFCLLYFLDLSSN